MDRDTRVLQSFWSKEGAFQYLEENWISLQEVYDSFLAGNDIRQYSNHHFDEKRDCSLITKDISQNTLLMWMVMNHPEQVPLYLKKYPNQNLNLQNEEGWTALMMAARNCHTNSSIECVQLLIKAEANLDLQNQCGWTALMHAARNCNKDSSIECVQLLIETGANLDLQNQCGWTALMYAARYCQKESSIECVQLLIEAGANLDLKNKDGNNALSLIQDDKIKIQIRRQNRRDKIKSDKRLNSYLMFYILELWSCVSSQLYPWMVKKNT